MKGARGFRAFEAGIATLAEGESQRVASHVAVLHAGKVRFFGELDGLKDRVKRVTVPADSPAAEVLAGMKPLGLRRDGGHVTRTVTAFDPSAPLPGASVEDLNLEDIFLEVSDAG